MNLNQKETPFPDLGSLGSRPSSLTPVALRKLGSSSSVTFTSKTKPSSGLPRTRHGYPFIDYVGRALLLSAAGVGLLLAKVVVVNLATVGRELYVCYR